MWIILSLIAAFFYALRYLVIKKYLYKTDTLFIAFISRFLGFIFLLPLLIFFKILNFESWLFWKIIFITSVFTGIASILQLKAIKKYDLSASLPFMAFVPLFMIFWVAIIFNEIPNLLSLTGLILLVIGTIVIHIYPGKSLHFLFSSMFSNIGGLLFLGVAVIFGLTTTLDRFAIDNANSGGFTYAFFWNLFSSLLFAPILFIPSKIDHYKTEVKSNTLALIFSSLFGVVAFLLQMLAVENAKTVNANVIYVKALVMLQIFFTVVAGVVLFKEKNAKARLIGSIIMIGGALTIIFFHK